VLFDGPYRLEPEPLGVGSLIKSIAVTLDRRLGRGAGDLVVQSKFHGGLLTMRWFSWTLAGYQINVVELVRLMTPAFGLVDYMS
jgi:hypothetical protein